MEFLSGILIAKAVVSISIVVGLSVVAERVGPRAAGLLTGMPLGAGIITVFTGIEQGEGFAARAAGFMVPGFFTTLVFVHAYAAVAAWRNARGIGAVLLPAIVAHGGYALAALLVGTVQAPLWISLPVMGVLLVATSRLMAGLPSSPITERVRFGPSVAVFRAVTATALILVVTGAAKAIGPQWTGILTGYPLTLFPLVIVLHAAYRGEHIAAVLKHVPLGLGGVLTFCTTVAYMLPAFGLALGVLAGYAVAFCYLLALAYVTRKPGVGGKASTAG